MSISNFPLPLRNPLPGLLRPYQADLLHKIIPSAPLTTAPSPGSRSLVQLPTGGGKTRIAVAWTGLRQPTPERPLWFVVHRRELFRQTVEAFKAAEFDPGAIAAGEQETPGAAIQIAMVQTLALRDATRIKSALVCVDEAHHSPARQWAKILRDNPDAEILGLTATPCRQDPKPLGNFFKTLQTSANNPVLRKMRRAAE